MVLGGERGGVSAGEELTHTHSIPSVPHIILYVTVEA